LLFSVRHGGGVAQRRVDGAGAVEHQLGAFLHPAKRADDELGVRQLQLGKVAANGFEQRPPGLGQGALAVAVVQLQRQLVGAVRIAGAVAHIHHQAAWRSCCTCAAVAAITWNVERLGSGGGGCGGAGSLGTGAERYAEEEEVKAAQHVRG